MAFYDIRCDLVVQMKRSLGHPIASNSVAINIPFQLDVLTDPTNYMSSIILIQSDSSIHDNDLNGWMASITANLNAPQLFLTIRKYAIKAILVMLHITFGASFVF